MADSRIDDLRRRLERDPGSRLFAQLAEELRKAGELEEAIGVARTGLAQHPAYPSARLTLGRALLDSGDPRAARVELETAVKGAPENILANRLLGEALESLGDLGGALAQYKATLAVAPGERNVEGRIDAIEARLKGGGEPGGAGGGTTARVPAAASRGAEAPAAARSGTSAEPEGEDEGVAPTIRIRAPGEPPLRAGRPPTPPPLPDTPGPPPAEAPPVEATQPTPATPGVAAPNVPSPPPSDTSPTDEIPEIEATAEIVAEPDSAVEAAESDVAPTLPPTEVRPLGAEEELPPTLPPSAPPVAGPGDPRAGTPPRARVDSGSAAVPPPMAFGGGAEPAGDVEPPEGAGVAIEPPSAGGGPPPSAETERTPVEPTPMVEPPVASREPVEPAPAPRDPVEPSAPLGEARPEASAASPRVRGADEAGAVPGTPLSSVTLAELYFQQGLLERAVEVYRQVLEEEPANSRARERLDEVQSLVAAAAADLPVPPSGAPGQDREIRRQALVRTIELLEGLLAAVRRR